MIVTSVAGLVCEAAVMKRTPRDFEIAVPTLAPSRIKIPSNQAASSPARCQPLSAPHISLESIEPNAVSDPRLRHQITRTSGILLQLPTELSHVYAKVLRLVCVGRAPGCLEQLSMRHHPAGVPHQDGEELVLGRSEVDHATGRGNDATGQIDLQVAHLDRGAILVAVGPSGSREYTSLDANLVSPAFRDNAY
jgi:hypothetical protein